MWKRFALATVLVVALTAGASATAALLQVNSFASVVFPARNHLQLGNTVDYGPPGSAQTVLLVGSDKRPLARSVDAKSPPHTDTMMLIRMDPAQGETSVLSIPRDLKVTIDGPRGPTVQKINAAYSIGGIRLALSTVKRVLGVRVNHVVDVNFKGFREAVDAVGCVYADVDRHYFNNNAGVAAFAGYATINIQPGYQQLCGQQALDYVRFRHTDSDFVRVARQQDFIRQFKEQVGVQGLLDKRNQLEHVAGDSIQTDIHGTAGTLDMLKLLAFSVGRPVRQVHFQATPGPSFVTASDYGIRHTVHDFLSGGSAGSRTSPSPAPVPVPSGRPRAHSHRSHSPGAPGLVAASRSDQDQAVTATVGSPFTFYYPRLTLNTASQDQVRRYGLRDEQHQLHHAFRIVFSRGLVGEYYGLQGMDWPNPPILTHPSETMTVGGRRLELYYDGRHLKLVAWRTPHSAYWVSNTLLEGLSNQQMLAIAESAAPPR